MEHLVFEPTTFNSGTATNIRPNTAEFSYGVRNFLNAEKRDWFKNRILDAIEKTAELYERDSHVLMEYMYGHPSLANSEIPYETVNTLLREAGEKTELQEINFGGEDFAHYLEHHNGVPGCMWLLGAQQPGSGAHHTPTFNPDETVFWKGVLFWLLVATK
jgi:metal-dependent amidase/aminoacylase/carboxypeptidase family protein